MGQYERHELISLLQNEADEDGNNALDATQDYIDSDDGSDRSWQYKQDKLAAEFKEGGDKEVEESLIAAIEKELNIENVDNPWQDIVIKVFGNLDEYKNFLAHIWWDTASYHGNENVGYFRDIDDLKSILKSGSGEQDKVDELLLAVREHYTFLNGIDNIVESMLDHNTYGIFFDKWADQYSTALEEVAEYLEKRLNDPSQTLFPFGGKLKATPGSFKELLKIMRNFGHEEMVMDLMALASGSYNKQHPLPIKKQ